MEADRLPEYESIAMSNEPAIVVENLHKHYRDRLLGGSSHHALRGIDLCVERGQVFGLLGPNGAGKTTLIKILLGIVKVTSGSARLLGHAAGSMEARKRIGYLPENVSFPHHHTAEVALAYFGHLSRVPSERLRVAIPELLDRVGLADSRRSLVRKFSKGMRQRLGIATALIHDPDLLVLDEPTDGLDPLGRNYIRDLIKQLRIEGKTIFLNSHILQEVELICDRVAILAAGTVRGVGTTAELIEQFHGDRHYAVELRLRGDEQAIQSWRSESQLEMSYAKEGQEHVLSSHVNGQGEVDRMIDSLRQAGISVCQVTRQMPSLEDVFLSTVNLPVKRSGL